MPYQLPVRFRRTGLGRPEVAIPWEGDLSLGTIALPVVPFR